MKKGISIEAMVAEVQRQQQAKNDYIVDTPYLEMEASGESVVMHMLDESLTDAVEPMGITQLMHRQLGTHLTIPATYYDRMLNDHPDLLAKNVNTYFRREPSRRMLRTMFGDARAWLSDRYRRLDNLDILEAAMPVICDMPGATFESCEITESRMYIKIINPRIETEVVPGDIVQAGVIISNSEVGLGSVTIQPLIFRLVCRNGMVIKDATIRKNHLGRIATSDENYKLFRDETLKADDHAFMMKVQDMVRAAADITKFNVVVDTMRQAAEVPMTATDIPGVVKLASRDYKLSDEENDGVLNHLIAGRDLSLYGLANAVTRFSQDVGDYDRATELEGIGYSVLTMEPQQWSRYNRAALPAAA